MDMFGGIIVAVKLERGKYASRLGSSQSDRHLGPWNPSMKPPAEEVEDDLAAEEENKLINEVRWQVQAQ